MPEGFQGAIFDVDGVLVDSPHERAWRESLPPSVRSLSLAHRPFYRYAPPPRSRMRWRLLATPPLSGAENMAVDEVLLRRATSTGQAVFRVYAWSAPTLSLGRNQPARDEYDPRALDQHRVSVVRRLTGGRAVLHHR